MNEQSPRTSGARPHAEIPARPQWWTDQHTSTWDRVKEALRRDWEQTKADLSSSDGRALNQNVADTVKQAAGAQPLPPPSAKTRPDDPKDAAKRVEKGLKERGDAQEKVIEAQTDVAVAQVRAQGEIASEHQSAQEKVVNEQRKLDQIAADAHAAALKLDQKAQEKIAKQQEKIAEVRDDATKKVAEVQQKTNEKIAEVQKKAGEKVAEVQQKVGGTILDARDWNQIESAVQYGYGARIQYGAGAKWDGPLEGRLQHEWAQLRGGPWDQMRAYVRRGWDAADRNQVL